MTFDKIDHSFAYPELSYDAEPNTQPCLKLSFYFKKLPTVSHEKFYGHWSTVHADLTVSAKDFGACNIQRYVQFSQTPAMRAQAKSLGLPQLDFDGCSEIWVRTWDDWMRFYQSKEFAAALGPDCDHFMELPYTVMAGYENVVFGEAVHKGIGGRDGILVPSRGRNEEGNGNAKVGAEGLKTSLSHVEDVSVEDVR